MPDNTNLGGLDDRSLDPNQILANRNEVAAPVSEVPSSPAPSPAPSSIPSSMGTDGGFSKMMDTWIKANPTPSIDYNLPSPPSSSSSIADVPVRSADDFEKKMEVLASQTHPEGINQNSFIKTEGLPEDYFSGRYDKYYLGEDNEDIAAKQQGAGEILGRALQNATVSFLKTGLESTIGVLAGTMYAIGGKNGEGYLNNPVTKTLSGMEELESPVYELAARRAAPWYSPTYWLSRNSLNTSLGMIGDVAAFYLTGKLIAAPIAGSIGKGILKANRAEAAFAETFQGIDKMALADYNEAISKYSDIAVNLEGDAAKQAHKELLGSLTKIQESGLSDPEKWQATTKSISDISANYASKMKFANSAQQIASGVITNLGMAQSSGYETMTAFKKKMLDEMYAEGKTPSEEEMAKIDKYAATAGSAAAFWMTMFGAVTFHGLTKQALSNIKGEGAELLLSKTNKIVQSADKEITLEGGQILKVPQYKEAGKFVADPKKGKFANYTAQGWNAIKKAPRTIQDHVSIWPGIGMVDMTLSTKTSQSYYEKKYKSGKDSKNSPFGVNWDLMSESFTENFKDIWGKEGASSFALGMVGALPFELGAKIKGRKQVKSNTQNALTALNDTFTHSALKANIDMADRHSVLYGELIDAVKSGDKETEKTLRSQILENWIFPKVKYGQTKFLNKELDQYKELSKTKEGIRELQRQGLIENGDNVQELGDKFREYIDKVKTRVVNTEKYYEATTLKYGGYLQPEHIEKLVALSGGIDDINIRVKELGESIRNSPIGTDPDIMRKYSEVLKVYETLAAHYNKENQVIKDKDGNAIVYGRVTDELTRNLLKDIENSVSTLNPDKKEDLIRDVADTMKLQLLKKRYFAEYEDIVKNPANYEDHVKTNIAAADLDETISNTKIDAIKVGNRGGITMDFHVGKEYYTNKDVQPGEKDNFIPFSKFKVDGYTKDDATGKRIVTITDTESGKTMEIPEDVFRKYKVNSVDNLGKEGFENAKFWMENRDSKFIYNYADENGELEWTEGKLRQHDSDNPNEFEFVPDDPSKEPVMVEKDSFRERTVEKAGQKETQEPRLQKVGDLTETDMDWLTSKESRSELEYKHKKFVDKVDVLYDLMEDKQRNLVKIESQIKEHKERLKTARADLKKLNELSNSSPDAKVTLDDALISIDEARSMINDIIKNGKESIKKLGSDKRKIADQIEDIDSLLRAGNIGASMGRNFIEEMKNIRKDLQDMVDASDNQIKSIADYISNASKTNKQLLTAAQKIAKKILKERDLNPMDIATLEKFVQKEFPDQSSTSYNGEMPEYSDDIKMLKSLLKDRKDLKDKMGNELEDLNKQMEDLEKSRDAAQKQLDLANEIIGSFNDRLKLLEMKQREEERLRDPVYTKMLVNLQSQFDGSFNNIAVNIGTEVPETETPNALLATSLKKGVTPAVQNRPEQGWEKGAGEFKDADGHSWVDRYNMFLVNRNSNFRPIKRETGSKYMGDNYKPENDKVVIITRQNQHHYFPKGVDFIEETYEVNGEPINNTTDTNRASVAIVHVYNDGDGYRFVDKNGKLLDKVTDKKSKPSELVFSRMETPLEKREIDAYHKKYAKFHLPEHIKSESFEKQRQYIESVISLAEQRRKNIVANTAASDKFSYEVSIGVPNYERNSNGKIIYQDNPISTTAFVTEEKIGTGILKIGTVSGKEEFAQITLSNGKVVNVKPGYPVVVNGDTITNVRTSKIYKSVAEGGKGNTALVDHLYDIIEGLAYSRAQSKDGSMNQTLLNYIKGILYFSSTKGENGKISANQIHFDTDGDLTFMLGTEKISMGFTPATIETNKDLIKEWLMQSFHGIDKKLLDSKSAFIQVNKVKYEKGLLVEPDDVTRWSTYEEYLLAAKDPNGKERSFVPLISNIVKYDSSKPWEGPMKSRYVVPLSIQNNDFFSSQYEPKEPTAQPNKGQAAASGTSSVNIDVIKAQRIELEFAIKQLEDNLKARVNDFIAKGASKEEAEKLALAEFPKTDKEALDKLKSKLAALPKSDTTSSETATIPYKGKNVVIDGKSINTREGKTVLKDGTEVEFSYDYTAKINADGTVSVEISNFKGEGMTGAIPALKTALENNLAAEYKDWKANQGKKGQGPTVPPVVPPIAPKAPVTPTGDSIKVQLTNSKAKSATIEADRIVFEPYTVTEVGSTFEREPVLYYTVDLTKPEGQEISFIKGQYLDELDNVGVKDFWSQVGLAGNRDAIGKAILEKYKPAEPEVKKPEPIIIPEIKPEEIKTEQEVQQEEIDNYQANKAKAREVFDIDEDAELMEVVSSDEPYVVGDREQEKKWIEANIGGSNYDLDIPEILKTGNGTFAFGMYKDNYIKLYKGAPAGAAYHEVYHLVEDSFLKPKQIKELRDEFRGRSGSFYDRVSGQYIPYTKATERQVRERLAEELRHYVLDNPNFKKPSKITNWFRKFVNFMKSFVFGTPTTIEDVFKKINSGYYRDSKIVKKPRISEADYMEVSSNFDPVDRKNVLDHTSAWTFEIIKKATGGAVRVADGMNEKEIFEPVFKAMKQYYEDPFAKKTVFSRAIAKENVINKNTAFTDEQKKVQIAALDAETQKAINLWGRVRNEDGTGFSDNFMKDLKSYMRKFNLVFDPNTNPRLVENEELRKLEEEAEVEQDLIDDKGRGYESDTLYIDLNKNAPLEIKIAFNTLIKSDKTANNPNLTKDFSENDSLSEAKSALSSFLGYQFVDNPSKYMYDVLEEMNGITDPLEIQKRLYEMAKKDPVLVRLYNAVYKQIESEDDWRMRVSFYQFTSRYKPDFQYMATSNESRLTLRSSNLDSAASIILKNWESELRGDNTGITMSEKGEPYKLRLIDNNGNPTLISPAGKDKEIAAANTIAFLKQIRFPVNETTMNKLSPKDQGELIKYANDFHKRILEKAGNTRVIGKESSDTQAVRKIARILAKTDVGVNVSTHQNMDNNKTQNYILHNAMTREMAKINAAGNLDNLLRSIERFRVNDNTGEKEDAFIRNSVILKKDSVLFDKEGNMKVGPDGEPFKFNESIFEGLHNEDADFKPKTSMAKMNDVVRYLVTLAHGIGKDGYASYPNFILADSKTERATTMPYYISPAEYMSPTVREQKVKDIVTGYLKDEINVIKENLSGKRTILSGARENDNYKKLQVFKDLLMTKEVDKQTGKITYSVDKELVDLITEHAQGKGEYKDLTTNEFVNRIKDRIYKSVETTFEKDIDEEVTKLEDANIIRRFTTLDGEVKYKFFGLNTEALKILGITGKRYTLNSVKDILRFRYLNQHIHLVEMRKLFYGPWMEVGDAPKRDKLLESGTLSTYTNDDNFNTWHTENTNKIADVVLKTSNPYHHKYGNSFRQLTFAEIKSISEAYPDMLADEMDAQGIILDRYHKEFKIRSGEKWSADDQRQHEYDIAASMVAEDARKKAMNKPSNITKEELAAAEKIVKDGNPHIDGVGTPLKPMGAGMSSTNGQATPFADKTSLLRLTYPIAKARGLEDLYWFMQDNDIAMTGPKSWQKYGRPSIDAITSGNVVENKPLKENLPQLYKIEGDTVRFGLNDLTSTELDRVKLEIPWENFNKIVETAKHGDGTGRGTQALSLGTLNTHSSGLPLDFYNPEIDDLKEKEDEWDAIGTEEAKKAKSDFYRLRKEHDDIAVERSARGYQDSIYKLGVVENQDGTFTFESPSKFVAFLEDQVTRQSLPDNVRKALKYEYDPALGRDVLVTPIEALADYKDLNNMIWSVIHKNVLTPKMSGTANILASSAGFEKKGLRTITNKNGQKFLSSGTLKFYLAGEIDEVTGKKKNTSEMEVYAPNFMMKKLKEWANASGKTLPSEKELFEYLNKPEGRKLLKAIGFRIPTQGLNSIDAIKIKPWNEATGEYFIPAEMGNTVIVPSEIVTKVGADFDIDKMFTYHYNFYVDSKGFPRAHDYLDDSNSTPEERYIRYVSKHNRNAGDMKVMKTESDDYAEMQSKIDAIYDERAEALQTGKGDIKNIRKELKNIKNKSQDIYEEGSLIFKTLPVSIRQKYFGYENEFKEQAETKGLMKLQLYNQFHTSMIEAVDELIKNGFTEQTYDYNYTDQKTKKVVSSNQMVDLAELKEILSELKVNSDKILNYNGLKAIKSESFNAIKDHMVNALKGIKTELDVVKEQQATWMLEASKQIAEARGIENFDQFRNMDMFKQNTTEAVENKYYDVLNELLLHPNNYEQLTTPNSVEELTDVLEEINNDLGIGTDRQSGDINYSNLLKPLFLNDQRQQFRDATDQSIGIAAQANTFHSQSQLEYKPIVDSPSISNYEDRKNMGLSSVVRPGESIPIWIPHKKIMYGGKEVSVYSGYKNAAGTLISNVISQVINGAVDAVKRNWLIELLKSKQSLDTMLFLGRIGAHPRYIGYFMRQPIIQEYIKRINIARETRGITGDAWTDPEKIKADVIKMTYPMTTVSADGSRMLPTKELTILRNKDFSIEELKSGLIKVEKDGIKMSDLTPEERNTQRQVLDEYFKYVAMKDHSFKSQQSNLIVNMPRASEASVKLKSNQIENARNNSVFGTNQTGVHGRVFEYLKKADNAIETISPVAKSYALDEIKSVFSDESKFINAADRIDIYNRATMSLLDYVAQVFTNSSGRKLNQDIRQLLIENGKDINKRSINVVDRLSDARAQSKGELKEILGTILSALNPVRRFKPEDHKNIVLSKAPETSVEADVITDAFRKLRDNPISTNLYWSIFNAGILQYGTRATKGSYYRYLPSEDVISFMGPIVNKLLDGSNPKALEAFKNYKAFYRNNFYDDKIVPKARSFMVESPDGTERRVYSYFDKSELISNYWKARAAELNAKGLSVPRMLALHEVYDAGRLKYPVVKTTEIAIDKQTGKQYTSSEIEKMAAKGDYSYQQTLLFQKVMVDRDNAYVISEDPKTGKRSYLYKQINAWGDGNNIQEYYDGIDTDNNIGFSQLDKNKKVPELSDADIINIDQTGQPLPKSDYIEVNSSFYDASNGQNLSSNPIDTTIIARKMLELPLRITEMSQDAQKLLNDPKPTMQKVQEVIGLLNFDLGTEGLSDDFYEKTKMTIDYIEKEFGLKSADADKKIQQNVQNVINQTNSKKILGDSDADRNYTLPSGKVIRFNDQQYAALQEMKAFHSNPVTGTFTLSGFAGTGKTTIVKSFIDEMSTKKNKYNQPVDIGVTAPTHKAVKVISATTQRPGFTVHKLLGLKPNIDIEKVSKGDLVFDPKTPPLMDSYEGGYVIVDEASMLNSVLVGHMKELASKHDVKLIFMGDSAQLPPIGETLSKVFHTDNVDTIEYLTKVERQAGDNPLMPVYDDIRDNLYSEEDVFSHETSLKDGKGIEFTNSSKKFEADMIQAFKSDRFKEFGDIKALSFTNDRVREMNKVIRTALFGKDAPMVMKDDVLTAYETVPRPRSKNIVDNSQDYKVINTKLVDKAGIKVHEVRMKETDSEYSTTIFIVNDDPESIDAFLERAKDLWEPYEKTKHPAAYAEYKQFLNTYMVNQALKFTGATGRDVYIKKSIDYGYAMTVHKSQGSTYNQVFVDENDIDKARRTPVTTGQDAREPFLLANKLKYVAFSRPTDKVTSLTVKAGEKAKESKPMVRKTQIELGQFENDFAEGRMDVLFGTDENKAKIGLEKGEVGAQKVSGKDFNIVNRGKLTVDEAGGMEAMLRGRNLSDISEVKSEGLKKWLQGEGKLWVYSAKPIETKAAIKENSVEENDDLINDLLGGPCKTGK